MYEGSVNTFIEVIKKYIRNKKLIVFEIGALDCKETLGFNELLNSPKIYTFECNPNTLPMCRQRIKGYKNIHLIEKAVTNKSGTVKFFPIDQKKTITTWKNGNPGASSLLHASGKYPVEKYVQKEIRVEAITLESFMKTNEINNIDLLWMDIQGAELTALEGLGGKISNVKFIHTEVEFFEIYRDQPLFEDVRNFLRKNGFILLGFTNFGQYAGDAVFVNKIIIKNVLKYAMLRLFGDPLLSRRGYFPISPFILAREIIDNYIIKIKRFIRKCLDKIIKRTEKIIIYIKLLKFKLTGTLVLEIKYGGLGDHLFYSNVPRLAKQAKKFKKVYISNYSPFRNKDIKRMVWEINPYIDGFCDEHGLTADIEEVRPGYNFIDEVLLYYGIDDGLRFHEPEIYYKPKLRKELINKIIYDPNFISNTGDKKIHTEVINYFKENDIHVDYQMRLRNISIPIDKFDSWLGSKSLEDFCDIIFSSGKIYCLVTGTATLASALGKKANVFFNNGVNTDLLHSKNNNYINLSKKLA